MLPMGSKSRRLLNQSTHSLSVCAVQPILAAIDMIAAHRDECSPSWSRIIRTARARTSGENLLLVCFVMAPPSQELEPPLNPGRFRLSDLRYGIGDICVDDIDCVLSCWAHVLSLHEPS